MTRVAALALLTGMAAFPAAAQSTPVDLGGVVLELSSSRTAQLFHIVDQLSQWDQYTHKSYVRWAATSLPLDSTDRALLGQHAALRRVRGWGQGFEQSFLVDGPIAAAAAHAVQTGQLSAAEASAEQRILEHFAPKLEPLLREKQPVIDSFVARLVAQRDRIRPTVTQLLHFAERTRPDTVPVYLVANTEANSGGGEANGGHLVVEVPSPDPEGITLHESLHVLLREHADAIRQAAEAAGLDFETLNEGIAYALSPGLTDDPARNDYLAEVAVRAALAGAPNANPTTRFNLVGLALRPLLRQALRDGSSITTFLPLAVARWRATCRCP